MSYSTKLAWVSRLFQFCCGRNESVSAVSEGVRPVGGIRQQNRLCQPILSRRVMCKCMLTLFVKLSPFFFLFFFFLALYSNASLQVLCVQMSPFAVSGSFHVHGPSLDQSFQYPCRNCGKRYRLRTAMFRHRKKCEGNYDLVCCLCEQRFYRRDRYNEHFLRVHRVSPP